MAGWQKRKKPKMDNFQCIIYAANHGVANKKVSAYPSEVTKQMVANFKNGGAAINQLCNLAKVKLSVIPIKLETPTKDFSKEKAMEQDEIIEAMQLGFNSVSNDCDLLILGEMGISNTSSATSATNLYDAKYYVITDEYNVYKCIRTGRDSDGNVVVSDDKPTGTSATALVSTSDSLAASGRGYLWKYMYTIGASDTIKFVTNDFIPVKTIGAQTEVIGDSAGFGSSATDDGSGQWDVENNAIDGGILHVKVNSGGAGYTQGNYTSVAINGDGSSGVCTVHVNASGNVSHVTVTTNGSGYKRATINVDGISGIGTPSTSAVVTPMISPQYGHGANPVEELGGNMVMINSRLEFAEGSGDFPTDNDFRRIGLIQDPFSSGTTVATGPNYAAYHKMTLSAVGSLAVDDTIMDANADGSGGATVTDDATGKSGLRAKNFGMTADARTRQKQEILYYVELPIPQDINDTQSVTWGEDTINMFELAGLAVAKNFLNSPAETVGAGVDIMQAAFGAGIQIPGLNNSTQEAFKAAIGGKAISALGSTVSPKSIISRATGQVLNSNLELLFQGVNLRSFPFSVTFSPRNTDEGVLVRDIIRNFKKSMSAKAGEDSYNGASASGIMISSPDVFLLEYRSRGKTHPFLNSFKTSSSDIIILSSSNFCNLKLGMYSIVRHTS